MLDFAARGTDSLAVLDHVNHRRRIPSLGTLSVSLHAERPGGPDLMTHPEEIGVGLGCHYQLANRSSGLVQHLGGLYGTFAYTPFVQLEAADRSWAATGENLFINLDRISEIRRLLIYVYAPHGIVAADAHIALDFHPACAAAFRIVPHPLPDAGRLRIVAAITPTSRQRVTVRPATHVPQNLQRALDQAYGAGLYRAGV